jgi:adenine-specific DNA-methyltransferase
MGDRASQATYRRPMHRARYTEHYVFSQLIPYIGNKRKLLPLIAGGIARTGIRQGTFVDLFTGSTVVARLAKTMGLRVFANDWEPYAHVLAAGTVALNRKPGFRALGGSRHVFRWLNEMPSRRGYVARHLCPERDEEPDPDRERMFFTRRNGQRIDAMREQIRRWEEEGSLSPGERAYLLSALLYSVSYVSNTSGVFKAFHRGWGGKTGTALYRILSRIELSPPVLHDNREGNLALREDALQLAPRLSELVGKRPDIVYLDPPYNQHPYGSNYHVLNTVALWDKPPLNRRTRIGGRTVDKSAIRRDWRELRRSPYNHRSTALTAFGDLLDRIDARWLLFSYSTDGMMPLDALLDVLCRKGRTEIFTQRYKRYRVSTPRMSPRPHTVEFLAVLDTRKQSASGAHRRLLERVRRAGA